MAKEVKARLSTARLHPASRHENGTNHKRHGAASVKRLESMDRKGQQLQSKSKKTDA